MPLTPLNSSRVEAEQRSTCEPVAPSTSSSSSRGPDIFWPCCNLMKCVKEGGGGGELKGPKGSHPCSRQPPPDLICPHALPSCSSNPIQVLGRVGSAICCFDRIEKETSGKITDQFLSAMQASLSCHD